MTYRVQQAAVWPIPFMDRIRIMFRGGLLIESNVLVSSNDDGSSPEIVDRSLSVAICTSKDRALSVSDAPLTIESTTRGGSN